MLVTALVTLLILAAGVIGDYWLGHWRHSALVGALLVFAVPGLLDLVRRLRARVTLRTDGIELRRLRTQLYPWSSLLSVELDDTGQVEITPNGWVRQLPIPTGHSQQAFELIQEWRSRLA